jgi:kinesin family protein 2/24
MEPKLNVAQQPILETQAFKVDYAFGPQDQNDEVYLQIGRPLVDLGLQGGLSCMFAYGQTGSGKTFTI